MLHISHMKARPSCRKRARPTLSAPSLPGVRRQQEAVGRRGLGLKELLWREDNSELGTQVAAPGEGTGERTRPSCCVDSGVTCMFCSLEILIAWPVWLRWLSIIPCTERSPVKVLVHIQVLGLIPGHGAYKRQLVDISPFKIN